MIPTHGKLHAKFSWFQSSTFESLLNAFGMLSSYYYYYSVTAKKIMPLGWTFGVYQPGYPRKHRVIHVPVKHLPASRYLPAPLGVHAHIPVTSVFCFNRNVGWATPKLIYSHCLNIEQTQTRIKVSKNITEIFDPKIYLILKAKALFPVTCFSSPWPVLTNPTHWVLPISIAVLAEISLRSPRKMFAFFSFFLNYILKVSN